MECQCVVPKGTRSLGVEAGYRRPRGSRHAALLTTMRDEEPPLPPASPPSRGPSRLRRTLHTLQTPFRPGSPFHIGLIKRTGSSKSVGSDSEITRDGRTMRKRNKKQREAATASDASRSTDSSPSIDKKKNEGSFIKRMGSFGKKRPSQSSQPPPTPQPESAGSSIVDTPPTPPQDPAPPKLATPEPASPEPPSPIAAENPIDTRPFAKAAWKRNSEPEMEKPVEEPSPESALRRRIAFVTQPSGALSEEQVGERGGGRVGSLEEAVALARERLAVPAPPSPAQSRDGDTEEEGYTDAMPAYGDLIEPSGDGAGAAVSVRLLQSSACGRARVSGRRVSVRCARAMTFEEAVDDSYLTVCECCGFSAQTTVLFPVRYISR